MMPYFGHPLLREHVLPYFHNLIGAVIGIKNKLFADFKSTKQKRRVGKIIWDFFSLGVLFMFYVNWGRKSRKTL